LCRGGDGGGGGGGGGGGCGGGGGVVVMVIVGFGFEFYTLAVTSLFDAFFNFFARTSTFFLQSND
jgi:hypothetical protein